jgi:hypothetical protein
MVVPSAGSRDPFKHGRHHRDEVVRAPDEEKSFAALRMFIRGVLSLDIRARRRTSFVFVTTDHRPDRKIGEANRASRT